MALFRTQTAALLLAGLTFTAVPAFAQNARGNGHEPKREAAARVPQRDRGEAAGRTQPQSQPQQNGLAQRSLAEARVAPSARSNASQSVQSRARVDAPANTVVASGRTAVPRYDNHVYDNHVYNNHVYDNRHYDNHSHAVVVRPYPYYPVHTYVVPYGYRPYGYRPGWSLNLYFGAPYATYGYPATYGYYSLQPGVAYGSLRIVDAPQNAQVLVDGYYAGVVDDYDGVFQHLNLVSGPHNIEIDVPGYEPILFAVNVQPGRTITYHANVA